MSHDAVPAMVYLNGAILPLHQASIPVLDRGFIFGDGVYEMIACFGRRPFRLERHQERLQASLAAARIDGLRQVERLWRNLDELFATWPEGRDCSLYVHVTRGVAPRDHAFPRPPVLPTVFAMLLPLEARTPEPAAAITRADIRWSRCDIKSTSLLANCLLRQEAVDAGVAETILLRDGHLTEGSVTSVFVVLEGRPLTPPLSHDVLPGVTRDLVIELMADSGTPVTETPVSEARLRLASEIWLTSTTRDIVPVVELDGQPVGDGRPGPLWRQALDRYLAFRKAAATGGPAPV
jgi:D-alanine transaminase